MNNVEKISVSIVGGSGYAGGDLLRLLLYHPNVEIHQITSERLQGKFVSKSHPNLRKITNLRFFSLKELEPCDILFMALPHGQFMRNSEKYLDLAPRIVDLSADFRLNSSEDYVRYYKHPHPRPDLLKKFVYGIPELHRDQMKQAKYISSAGCNAIVSILGLYPLYKNQLVELDRTVIEVKAGSSEGGNKINPGSHHPERSGVVRSYAPTQHRHVAEIVQELGIYGPMQIFFSATSIDIVRGILSTSHVFLKDSLSEKDIWRVYRKEYASEPFIRIVKERDGIYRYPEPKILSGTNFCDIGFEVDPQSNRAVIISAIDNLMKGAAGQAVQALNILFGYEETLGLEFPGLHPI
ncbi:MAG: N-acetyl-gamma-glutamyl-phosphate reductase [Candidatus Hermodarchaeota archaeon]